MQNGFENITTVAHVIQLAVAPVFLLTGIGAILTVLISRLGRIVDRSRVLKEQHDPKMPATMRERRTLAVRAFWVHWAIVCCTVAALLVSVVIVLLFLASEIKFDPSHAVSPIFILAMLSLIAGLLFFVREIYLSTHTIEPDDVNT
jgi:hypothetical protein